MNTTMPTVILAADRRECVVVRGRDARSFLQSQISQDLDVLTPGAGARSLLLEPQGKLLASFRVLCLGPEEYLLDTDQGVGSVLVDGLRRFMIRVAVEVVSADDLRIVEVRGNGVDAVLGACGWTAPPEPGAHELVTDAIRVVRAPWPPVDGVDLVVAASHVDATVGALVAAGATVLDAAATETLRVESGVVRQGADIDASTIAHEAHLDLDAVSFTKGCFVGQELVCRIDSRGHVNRFVRRLRVDGASAPAVGTAVLFDDREVGVVTSSAPNAPLALATVRREVEPGATVLVAGVSAVVESIEPTESTDH